MATSNQGTKFRRVSSNKNRVRSVSSDDILRDSPPSYPDVMSYDASKHHRSSGGSSGGERRRAKVHRNSSSSQGESFGGLQGEERAGSSAYSIAGTATSLDSVNPEEYDHRGSGTHTVPYTRSHSGGGRPTTTTTTRWRRGQSDGVPHQHNRRSLNLPPQPSSTVPPGHAILDSSRESFTSGRGLVGSYNRQLHLRDSMSQDTMPERDFEYQFRYNMNNSTTLPTLSLQDSYHHARGDHHHMRSSRGSSRERDIVPGNNNRDLRRGVQEFDVMPIHEVFSHNAMAPAASGPGGGVSGATHLSPHTSSPHTSSPQESGARGGGCTVIDCQPLALTDESQHNQQSAAGHNNNSVSAGPPTTGSGVGGGGGGIQQQLPQTYLPVFFSPETGQLYTISVDGTYKPLPSQYDHITHSIDGDRGTNFNQSDQRLSVIESSGRQTSSSYGITVPYDYYHCSLFMMLVYMLCLNVIVVLLFSLPAIWFAKRAMRAKYEGDYVGTLSLGTRALCFNIIGGCIHILFLCSVIFIPILLQFVFGVI